ncbi:MAG: hypothetical protein J7L15_06350 [Clostridiales bacterium]|nr:hypothetical protein [Clostridiales bacterium]
MISEKLLLEVLDYPNGIVNFGTYDNEVLVLSNTACHDDVYNIYELAHRCKEWASKKGYWIDSNLTAVSIGEIGTADVSKFFNKDKFKTQEQGLVFEACEWILKETK